jgi:hypothetical protein
MNELSKSIDGARIVACKEMLRVVKFVLDTKLYCLEIQPKDDSKECTLVSYYDSDWAGDA